MEVITLEPRSKASSPDRDRYGRDRARTASMDKKPYEPQPYTGRYYADEPLLLTFYIN